MIEKALDDAPVKVGHQGGHQSELTFADDIEATDYRTLIGFELFKQSLTATTFAAATGGNFVW
jgi:hypothetical protein